MPHDKRHIHWPKDEHPSLELLRQYQQEELSPAQAHQVEKHLLDCELCSDVLEGMALSDPSQTKAAVQDIQTRLAVQREQEKQQTLLPVYLTDWRVAASLLLLVGTAVLVLYYNYVQLQAGQPEIARVQEAVGPAAEEKVALPAEEASAPPTIALGPDTVPPAIVAAPAKKRPSNLGQDELFEEEKAIEDLQIPLADTIISEENVPMIAAAPVKSTAAPSTVTESVMQDYAVTPALVPDSGSIAKALQGQVAGVSTIRIRGSSTIPAKSAGSSTARMISGRVLSEAGEPLPGVTVQLKGTKLGTTTDAEGNYTLPVFGKEAVLVFNFIGYKTEERLLAQNASAVDVNLNQDRQALSEVVVVGYGESKGIGTGTPAFIPAEPTSGRRAFRKYLQENMRAVPEKGRVTLTFTVSPTGTLEDFKVKRSLCPDCDAEALRLVQNGPAWKPATRGGTPVAQEVKVKVRFKK
ncbi:TonB family protein [Pontibacter ummariensis]|uniref:TonB family C-terminal domain-containing protein n=1 Tax=Pontibacter ummariensis TaxID=1610492 RepID=A0A239I813_9BACT|nr:TonB family protein [Pontibacter ummariensis]PRY09994.1 TonB family protein [Pontibacter ummariensis]SNS89730.1 TonB family C-terminal domain-containing protein [Pontibacter ummariensis]